MPTRFAFPIMHITSGDYLPFTDKFLLGRTFFQPIESLKVKDLYPTGGPPEIAAHLNDPISRFYAPGIEMFFDGVDAEVSKIYSMFDGFITWIGDRLILTPEPKKALQELSKTDMLEAGLGRVIYENIEKASMKTALVDLILTSYQAANKHPILKCALLPGPVMTTFNAILSVTLPADRESIIGPIVDSFLAGGGQTFPIKAGELLGKADFFKATDELPDAASRPAWFKTIADADRARKILVITKDVGKQVLNPWYYLHNYVSSQTPITIHPYSHPLLAGTVPPTYGRNIIGTTYYFPLGALNTLHGVPSDDSDSKPFFSPRSTNKWRYDDDGFFEANEYNKAGNATAFAIPDGVTAQNKFNKLRTTYLTLLNDYCEKLQIPVGLMFGIFGAETSGKSTADVRLEPLYEYNEKQLAPNTTLIDKYNKLTGFHCQASRVMKKGDDFKFLVEKSELIKGIDPITSGGVGVPMRFYYDKDKYWLLKTIDIEKKDAYKTGFTGKQGFGKTVFYPLNKVNAGKPNLVDVQITMNKMTKMTKSSYLRLDRGLKDKLFKKKPRLNTTITIWVNGVESDLSFTMGIGDWKINDPKILEQEIVVSPTDQVGMSVETDGTAGEIEGLDVRFKLTSIWVTVPKSDNKSRATFAEITHVTAGMVAGGYMGSATTKYFPIGSLAAGVSDSKTVATFKAPGDGFLLISELNVDANTLKKSAQVNILRKDGTDFKPTGIIGTIAAGAKKTIMPFSEMVEEDEEFILEITTPAAASKSVPEQLGRVTMNVYFVPFNNDESFLTSKHGYSFDLSKLNRTVTTEPIKTENGRTMTWDELYEVIRKTYEKGAPLNKGSRISIGPFQTLISTAMGTVRQQATNINRLIAPLSLADPILFIDYLIDPAKSLAIGVVLIRSQYNFYPDLKTGQNFSTQFDIPLVSSVHNASRNKWRDFKYLRPKKDETTKEDPTKEAQRRWGLIFAYPDSYILNAGSMFNVAQKKTKVDFIPTVQFKK